MQYLIMRKNEIITVADFDEEGRMLWYSQNIKNECLAPLQEKSSTSWLKKWWEQRSIPIGQNKVDKMLKEKGLIGPEDYLLKNLGLSLTDYYWVKPINANLRWEEVNLFDNNFQNELTIQTLIHDNVIEEIKEDKIDNLSTYNPNSSLQGQLEKKWIIYNQKRYLVKGNRNEYSTESINEVIVSKAHEMQEYDNYTAYKLIKIKNSEYDYGCISECFTNQNIELVSAYGVVTSETQKNDVSSFNHFINICEKHGMDKEQLQNDLDYQMQMDFIFTGRDRHLSNVSILRDADTLEFLRMAPIYDSGKCLFIDKPIPLSTKELLSVETTSFAASELKLLKHVKDRSLVDVSKLPSTKFIQDMYQFDSKMDEKRVKLICDAYEKKVELYRDFQLGNDLNKIKIACKR